MGWNDCKWIVEYEASSGVFSSTKKGTMVVEASSEYSAKDKAKAVLRGQYSYVKVLSAHKSCGRSEESKTTFKPKEAPQSQTHSPSTRTITPEEREAYRVERKRREELEKQRAKLDLLKAKGRACEKATKYHIRVTILVAILSAFAFLLSWIPHWIALFKEAASKTMLAEWIDLGHSESDDYAKELAADIIRYHNEAISVVWIPFVVLAIGIGLTVLAFFLARKKTPLKMEKAKKEMEVVKEEYEAEYGKIM